MKTPIHLWGAIILLLFQGSLYAQFDDLGFDTDNFSLKITAGGTASLPIGKDLETLKDLHRAFEEEETGPHTENKAGFPPFLGFHVGALIAYQISDELGLETGIVYTKRGFSSSFVSRYEDFEYQYDQEAEVSSHVHWNTLDIPINLRYKLLDWVTVHGGILILNSLQLNQEEIQKETVWINTKIDDGYSTELTDERDLDEIKNSPVGLTLGVELGLSEALQFRIHAQQTGKIFNTDSQVSILSLNVTAIYTFSNLLN
ncbi:MAG: hypothetical protein AAF696_07375 [Bacteroidota bacterium]